MIEDCYLYIHGQRTDYNDPERDGITILFTSSNKQGAKLEHSPFSRDLSSCNFWKRLWNMTFFSQILLLLYRFITSGVDVRKNCEV